MQAAFPARDLIQLTNEDPRLQEINEPKLQTQLDQSSQVIDGYIEGRFALPFPTPPGPPSLLKTWCMDIAMYRLQCLRPLHDIEDARKRYEDALKALTLVNQRKLTLGLAADGITEPAASIPSVLTLPNGAADASIRSEPQASMGLAPMFGRQALRSF
jgi:phage gp36-like protein